MGQYTPGDVLLAPVRLGGRGMEKVRPVLVMGYVTQGMLLVCPISSHPPRDTSAVALSLGDFQEGGLDILDESYLIPSLACPISSSDVVAKKGRLSPGIIEILSGIPGSGVRQASHPGRSKKI